MAGKWKIGLIPVMTGFLALPGQTAGAQETLHPQGSNIIVNYALYQTINQDQYIFNVYRTIINNENFNLTGTYLSDNIPDGFRVKTTSAEIDGDSIGIYFTGPIPDQSLPGYNTFRWVIDIPPGDHIGNVIRPGQQLILRYEFIGPLGNYVLPFHTACFFGGEGGYFTTADSLFIPIIPQDIPTLNEWGFVILSFLILAAGSIALVRRKSSPSPVSA